MNGIDNKTKELYKSVDVKTLQELNSKYGFAFVFADGVLIDIIKER